MDIVNENRVLGRAHNTSAQKPRTTAHNSQGHFGPAWTKPSHPGPSYITSPRVYLHPAPHSPNPPLPRRRHPTGERNECAAGVISFRLARRRRTFRRRRGEPPTLCSRRIWWVCCDVLQVRRRRRGCLTASSSTRGTAPSASSPGSGPPATAARVRTHLSLSPVRWFRRSCFPTVVRFVCVSLPIVWFVYL